MIETDWIKVRYIGETYQVSKNIIVEKNHITAIPLVVWNDNKKVLMKKYEIVNDK